MKKIAEIIQVENVFRGIWTIKSFHVRLEKGIRHFFYENIVRRHIGPRPWGEMTWMDNEGHVHEVFTK